MDLEHLLEESGYTPDEAKSILRLKAERDSFITGKDAKGMKLSSLAGPFSEIKAEHTDFTGKTVIIGAESELGASGTGALRAALMEMWPWRKGPFSVFGIEIDTEWRSDLKWDRVIRHITPLEKRHVLDIGSSSGYYMFRMLPYRPAMVIGLEPYINFYCQFRLLNSFARADRLHTLPFRFEELPQSSKKFNTIFCMGILYHRRSPIDFLKKIKSMLSGKGELVLETMILEGDGHYTLTPVDRYAMMQNVYFIPAVPVLISWLRTAGFTKARCVDISPTTQEEQRRTPWVNTESLDDFLDPTDRTRTVEGYQAPVRAVIIAET